MKRTITLLSAALVAMTLLAGCSTGGATPRPSDGWDRTGLPDELISDPAITGLLPIGPHQVDFVMTAPGGSSLTIKGYLELGQSGDGKDCRADLSVVQDIKGETPSLVKMSIRRDGAVTWHRLDNEDPALPIELVGRWIDATDVDAVRPTLIWLPLFITDGMPIAIDGGSSICALRYLDQTATLDSATGLVTFDQERVRTYMKVAFELFTEQFLKAGGADTATIAKLGAELASVGAPDYWSFFTSLKTDLRRDGGNLVMTQDFGVDEFSLTARFQPTSVRTVPAVTGAQTIYDRLKADPDHQQSVGELAKVGLQAWIAAQSAGPSNPESSNPSPTTGN